MIITFSKKITRIPFLSDFLQHHCQFYRAYFYSFFKHRNISAVVGWGLRPSTHRARLFANNLSVPYVALEDGFVRSFGLGNSFPPLSLIVDAKTVYYNAYAESELESLLNSDEDFLALHKDAIVRAKMLMNRDCISKYNHAPCITLKPTSLKKVLVIDQTSGDVSIQFGHASRNTFIEMLNKAREENDQAHIYIKVHPETVSGRKQGHLTHLQDDSRTTIIREDCNPIHLLKQVDHVYTVTSTMGFEALLLEKPVTVLGLPWYSGWGVTDDRQTPLRRTKTRSVDELFACAYFSYARYLNPETHQAGNIFDLIQWIQFQKKQNTLYSGRKICIGFRLWKKMSLKPMLAANNTPVIFVKSVAEARKLSISAEDNLVFWGATPPKALLELKKTTQARLLQIEDGLIRSVGLGSDFVRPLSLVFDDQGLYFNPAQPSRLEHILNHETCTPEELQRAKYIQDFIIRHDITKYNIEPCEAPAWHNETQKTCILVVGQVDNDASIQYGALNIKTNLELLKTVRANNPDAYIVYKSHPDVIAKNRKSKLTRSDILKWADYIESDVSIISCIKACDEIHTITSTSGFDALVRNKKVFAYGKPFYAGWGLLANDTTYSSRTKTLNIQELIAGVLIKYPIYWDWSLNGYTSCEAALAEIVRQKTFREQNNFLEIKSRYLKRILYKINLFIRYLLESRVS